MEVAVVVGAGATLAEAISHRPIQSREYPPLDTNFFSKAVEIQSPLISAMKKSALAAGMSDPFGKVEPRMEEFFGDVYYEVQDPTNLPALEAYRTLLRLYTRTLADTTRWFYDRPLGALGRWIRLLLTIPQLSRLTLLSFNHDLVLENVLVQLPRTRRWCVDQGYGPVSLKPVNSKAVVERLPRHSATDCDHSIPIEILKLHGSLNWQVETRSHDPSYRDLFPTAAAVRTMECIIDRIPNVTLQRAHTARTYKLWPQIIPPIYGKQQLIANRFGPLWTHAQDRLRTANRIIFVGYSLPPADVHTEKMISRCLGTNNLVDSIEVVNPDRSSAQRFAEITDARSLTWYRDLADFVV